GREVGSAVGSAAWFGRQLGSAIRVDGSGREAAPPQLREEATPSCTSSAVRVGRSGRPGREEAPPQRQEEATPSRTCTQVGPGCSARPLRRSS
ncbi:unnamed protein product, partial [Musa acuminata var. zebrina]